MAFSTSSPNTEASTPESSPRHNEPRTPQAMEQSSSYLPRLSMSWLESGDSWAPARSSSRVSEFSDSSEAHESTIPNSKHLNGNSVPVDLPSPQPAGPTFQHVGASFNPVGFGQGAFDRNSSTRFDEDVRRMTEIFETLNKEALRPQIPTISRHSPTPARFASTTLNSLSSHIQEDAWMLAQYPGPSGLPHDLRATHRPRPLKVGIKPPGTADDQQLTPTAQNQSNGFRPMAAVAKPGQRNSTGTVYEPRPNGPLVFSGNYKGDHSIRNASVDCLPTDRNCALWLTNLPPDVSHRELLACIRSIGRIWCTVINAPDYDKHSTAAAKVVFFTPSAAQTLLTVSLARELRIRGHRVKITHNRVKYDEKPLTDRMSRTLIVTGKTSFVNESTLTAFFKERFVFEIDEVIPLITAGDRCVVEYRFGSYRCQSQMGKMSLEKDKPQGLEKVEFGDDPCEVGDTLASYGVAADRIQGRGI